MGFDFDALRAHPHQGATVDSGMAHQAFTGLVQIYKGEGLDLSICTKSVQSQASRSPLGHKQS
jgi:hypothetical protein